MICCIQRVARLGVAGTSEIGPKVIPALRDTANATLIGVGSRHLARAKEYCKKHNAGEGMTYDDLLGRADIDGLYVPFPTKQRADFISKAIDAGKHIYSEKPLGGSVAELKALLDACEAKGLQWFDGTSDPPPSQTARVAD